MLFLSKGTTRKYSAKVLFLWKGTSKTIYGSAIPLERNNKKILCGTAVPFKRNITSVVPFEMNSSFAECFCCSISKERHFRRIFFLLFHTVFLLFLSKGTTFPQSIFLLFLLKGTTVSQIVFTVPFKGNNTFE